MMNIDEPKRSSVSPIEVFYEQIPCPFPLLSHRCDYRAGPAAPTNKLPRHRAEPAAPDTVAQNITVTTTIEPLPLAESNRSVNLINPREQPLLSNSVVDYLRQDASLNLQARAPNGVQADLSLRGTTFEQSLILLNGLRINDPETGHLNLDIPVPLDAVTRIDILHGSGSTFYGSDAIGGAVNLLTQPPAPGLNIIGSAGAGSYTSLSSTSVPPTPKAP